MSGQPDYTVLAAWEFHGERFEVWNQQERMWVAHYRRDQDAWELLWMLWDMTNSTSPTRATPPPNARHSAISRR